ncbi:MAG: ShlB/FhaC/HecB family hemolysin secretion/activation protein [Zhongshania sp.]|uniref:ShlB/FhaC/HecB family hemolysin secretion/activation protein n=1 Tax=Zhongshania sp. TaxID=1971902 RepID=UPI002601FF6E|nr:ShlB/FhaC/HecB family hemolysin secretion/activation protein [Zhongshania sp.]MDF1692023.1 ShlB/FhaC/HecB family hemolysin secretion/activation protein [Zhongshania sp.]
MAIDLPPLIPPQASTAERIEQYSAQHSESVIAVKVGDYDLRISGNRYLTREQIDMIMGAAKSPAQAVNALNQAYYQLGHLLVTVYFAQRDKTIFAHVINGKLAAIKAPDSITPYFSGLVGDEDLRKSEFGGKQVLANLKSDRAGLDYAVTYQVAGDPAAYTLVFTERPKVDHDSTELSVSANNFGNRFLGRYFGNVSLKHDFSSGIDALLSYDRALTEFGEVNGGDYYDGYTFRLSYPSSFGLYGIEARYTEYQRDTEVLLEGGVAAEQTSGNSGGLCAIPLLCDISSGLLGLDLGLPSDSSLPSSGGGSTTLHLYSETTSVALTGEQVISGDSYHRFTSSQRLEKIDSFIDVKNVGLALDEPHTTLELGLKYNKLLRLFGVGSQLTAQGFVEAGLEGDAGTLGTDSREGVVAVGRRTGEFVVFKPRAGLKMAVADWASIKFDVIGQFSNNQQLPLQQQFFLGGGSGLSAYLPGVLVGDSGVYSKLSLESNGLPFLGLQFKPSLFIEHGEVWYEDAAGQSGDVRAIADAGFTLEAELGKYLKTELIAATPIYDDNLDEDALSALEVDFFWRIKLSF